VIEIRLLGDFPTEMHTQLGPSRHPGSLQGRRARGRTGRAPSPGPPWSGARTRATIRSGRAGRSPHATIEARSAPEAPGAQSEQAVRPGRRRRLPGRPGDTRSTACSGPTGAIGPACKAQNGPAGATSPACKAQNGPIWARKASSHKDSTGEAGSGAVESAANRCTKWPVGAAPAGCPLRATGAGRAAWGVAVRR